MEDKDGSTDASSIKPVSSLRTRFENLGKDSAPSSPIDFRQIPRLSPRPQPLGAKPPRSVGDGDADLHSGGSSVPSGGQTPPTFKKKRPEPPRSRPASMISMSTPQHSPLLVTVESPHSPQKNRSVDLRPSGSNSPFRSLSPAQTKEGSESLRPNTGNRSPSPIPESWANSPLHPNHNIRRQPSYEAADTPPRSKTTSTGDPPLINRASKPKIPSKPAALGHKPANLAAPDRPTYLTDHSISPFSTPPSSQGSSPDPSKDRGMRTQQPASGIVSAPLPLRPRTNSDAPWVERIRADSDASLSQRSRAESGASFVEPSSLPDVFLPPPTHHKVAGRREEPFNGQKGGSSLPSRYKHRNASDMNTTNKAEEELPRLPVRPELQVRSGRTSPTRARLIRIQGQSHDPIPKQSVEGIRRPNADIEAIQTPDRSTPRSTHTSALNQGFDRVPVKAVAPAIPAPRRSIDRRRDPLPAPLPVRAPTWTTETTISTNDLHQESLEQGTDDSTVELNSGLSGYPDGTRANRRPPKYRERPYQIPTEYDTRLFAVCGDYICTSGYITKAWNLRTGEELLHMTHREYVKVSSIAFKPSSEIENEGKRIWLGTNVGEIHEVDIPSQSLVKTQASAHARRDIIRIFRYASEMWTLDDGGELDVWRAKRDGMPSLNSQAQVWRIPRGHTYSLACGSQLWIAFGKEIRVFLPSAQTETQFQLLRSPLMQPGTGDVTCGTMLNSKPGLVYFSHSDGKVSVYDSRDFTCTAVVNVSLYRIISLTGVGDYLWAGYSTGMAYVYDTSTNPWTVKKDWQAHDKQISGIIADPSAIWKTGRLNVVTLGTDNYLKIWNGTLEDDWLDSAMQGYDSDYCSFREMTAAVLTWNAGAAKPHYLSQSKEDSSFLKEYVTCREPPDIFVFGFQELVDLEDKKMTAKSFFKSKKKDPSEQEHMSHQYRAWRDHLIKCIDEYMPGGQRYTMLHCSSMVGLFTCIFVRSSEKMRIRHVHTAEVKRGMGGLHGNKGAIMVRMVLDDSSLCFINCHLAAGQTHTIHRNNDIAAILESSSLPPFPLSDGEVAEHSDVFTAGGDGSMILDHEICILNGDLNYRIDTMGRDTVIKHVKQGNLARLLERDQLLLSRKKNPGFRLRAFQESPIMFAPTYKYDVQTDNYDSSEKRRSPAWCDRILYRGLGKVKMEEYRRWDRIRVSDHRPVSGWLKLRIKTVDPRRRELVWDRCVKEHEEVRTRIARAAYIDYLTNILGMPHREAITALSG